MPPSDSTVSPAVLLVDNGSLTPAATLSLRALAGRLSTVLGREVQPISLLHSSTVDPALLGGRPAEILEPTLRKLAEGGTLDVVILPLFLGPSAALTEYLPERVRHLCQTWPNLKVRVAPCLVNSADPADQRVAAILADRVREAAKTAGFIRPAVAVVDHGTPQPEVNAVRNLVASHVRNLLGDAARCVQPCSMERRPEPVCDFNEPLLATLLNTPDFSAGEIIVARLFLQPGRHAGPGGDVEQIARAAQVRHPGLKIAFTEPLASHPGLVPILAERFNHSRLAHECAKLNPREEQRLAEEGLGGPIDIY